MFSHHVSVLTAASDTPAALWSRAVGVAGKRQRQGYPLQWEGGSRAEVSRALREDHLQKGCCWSVPPPSSWSQGWDRASWHVTHFVTLLIFYPSVIEQMAKICRKFTITRKGKAETLFFFQENLEK